MKVLIIQQKMIGDVLTSTLLFEVLRERFPSAQLDYLVNGSTTPVLENNPLIDNIIAFTPEMETSKNGLKQLREIVKNNQYDVVIDAYAKISSAWITKSSNAKYRIGYKKWYTSVAYTHTFKRRDISLTVAGLAVENRLLLIQPLVDIETTKLQPKIYLTPLEKKNAYKRLIDAGIDFDRKLYMISVLGSNEFKTYPLPFLATLLDYIVSTTNAQLLFNYIPSQQEDVNTLYSLCKPETQKAIYLSLYGKSLREFIALTSHCDALIGNEGGAVNMAKAIGIRTFAIFSTWIKKGAWSVYEDGTKHRSVHLYDYIDYNPLFSNKKSAKRLAATQYKKFTPDLIIPRLHEFITGKSFIEKEKQYSATVITYNEEKNIARCIESLLPVTNDIIILDSLSNDKTKEICQQYPVRFVEQAFLGHIQQKNMATDLAKNDRIISLDADEALSKEMQAAVLRLQNNWTADGYYVQRFNNYCGQWIQWSGWNPDRKLRVFDRRKARWGGINPHDTIQLEKGSKSKLIKGSILHWVHRNQEEHKAKVHKFSSIAAKEYHRLGRTSTWLDITLKPIWTFFKGYILRLGILDGYNGLIICTFSAKTTYLKYLKLKRLIDKQKQPAT